MVEQSGFGHLLQEDGFASAGRGDNESALSHADGCDEIDDTGADEFGVIGESEAFLGVEWCEVVEEDFVGEDIGVFAVDGFDYAGERNSVRFPLEVGFGRRQWPRCGDRSV